MPELGNGHLNANNPVFEEQIASNVGPAHIDIAYQRLGSPGAPPLLMIMGAAAQMIHWPDSLCHMLVERGLHVIRFDNRDSGHSTPMTSAPSPNLPAALAGGWADSVLLQTLQPRMIVPPAKPTGSIRTMLKDMDAVEALAAESGVQLPVAKRVRDWLAKAVEDGFGESDISQIVTVRRH